MRHVAVVGAGVAGISAAYVLQREHEVTLFEADSRLGGHAHTHEIEDSRGHVLGVDTGFLVHNERTYPQLLRLFDELGVATQPTEMSMSIRCDGCGLEYAGALGLSGFFPTARNLARPRYLRLLSEVPRFHRQARRLLASEPDAATDLMTIAEFLDAGRFSTYFRTHFVRPLIACVWSCGADLALDYPARYLFRFLDNHGMLTVTGSPTWRTVTGGSARYVERAAKNLSAVESATPIASIRRVGNRVEVRDDADRRWEFDAIVIATHPDQALRMLPEATAEQRRVLGSFEYSDNRTLLHQDPSVLPVSPRSQASWNYLMRSCDAALGGVEVSYDLNRLQQLETDDRYFVTLNDPGTIDPESVVERMDYAHPIFTPGSVAAQAELPALNDGVFAFAGAYHGWGFHEDGCRSGIAAAASLGVDW